MDSDSQLSGFASTQSDDEEYKKEDRKRKRKLKKAAKELASGSSAENILIKLRNRQIFGYFSSHPKKRCTEQPFKKVPATLSFCLKDIIPCCYLDGHIFMGLTACGQFLLSYKVHIDDEISASYDFSTVYRYKLFFWIYRPHNPLHKYFSICLFDDHGIDGMKKVTMTQWKTDSAVLVVHGESDTLENDSYVTYVRVPKLGCLDCRELRRDYFDPAMPREAMLCVKCALMIHVKYRSGESAPKFTPEINLNAPGFILMSENTFIHAVSVDLDMTRQSTVPNINYRYTPFSMICHKSMDCDARSETVSNISENDAAGRRLTIADEIIADFEEFETESMTGKLTPKPIYDEASPLRVSQDNFKRQIKHLESTPSSSSSQQTTIQEETTPLKDITLSTKVSPKEKIKMYEFSEENEKCEKISTFRKRRLADKKYEFIEDSFDSILPFNRIRDRIRSRLPPGIAQNTETQTGSHLHRASPNQGFRSPCGSPVGYRFLRSPPGMRSPNYYNYLPNNVKYFGSSPRAGNRSQILPLRAISSPIHRPWHDIENNENQQSLSNLKTDREQNAHEIQEPWKNLCSKKFTRRYVEEDDANSVITTTEEDDCISPGYHTSLPLEVHGACYSNMQTISRASCVQLKNRPVVFVTQNTFDTESFTVNVATFVCKQNNKVYDMLSDSTYAIIHVCPISSTLTCLMKIEFFANEANVEEIRMRRITARQKFQLRTLFTWNIADGALNVLDYGKLALIKGARQPSVTIDVNELTSKLCTTQNQIFSHLRVLKADTSKSKQKLTDMQNMIEFYRKNKSNMTDFSSFSDGSTFNEEEDETSGDENSLSD